MCADRRDSDITDSVGCPVEAGFSYPTSLFGRAPQRRKGSVLFSDPDPISASIAGEARDSYSDAVTPKRGLKFLLSLLVLLGCGVEAGSASSWFARVWQVERGADSSLPSDSVTGIAQTRNGYLWIATQSGLAKFDGLTFQDITIPSARPEPIIRSMLLDEHERLWVAEEAGLVAILPTNGTEPATLLTTTNGLPRAQPLEIVEARDGAVWLSYVERKVCRIVDKRGTVFGPKQGLPANGICNLTTDAEGRLWFAKGGQVGWFENNRFVTKISFTGHNVRIKGSRGPGIWVCAGERVLKYDGKGEAREVCRIPFKTTVGRVASIFEDGSGVLWVGTSAHGLFRFDGNRVEKVETSHNRIRAINEDREGNIWVGTDGGGLNRLRPQVVRVEGKDAGLPFDTVRSVCEDTAGGIWVVTENGELIRRKEDEWMVVSSSDAWPKGQATCVACDTEGVVTVGTFSYGLYRWDGKRFRQVRRSNGLSNMSVRSLLADTRGDLWVGFASGNVVQRLSGGNLTSFDMPEGSAALRTMAEDSAGKIWLATSKGQLLRVDGTRIVDETSHTPAPRRAIRCLAGTEDGSLWIGYSAGGVGRLKGNKFVQVGLERGLQDGSICTLMPDNHGWMWFCSDHGIFRVLISELSALADGRIKRVESVGYGRDEGLQSVQGSYGYSPGATRCRDGRVLLATHSGLAIIHPDRVKANRVAPPVIIESVKVDAREVPGHGVDSPEEGKDKKDARSNQHGPGLILNLGHKKLEVAFTAPSFVEPEKVRFRYWLEGWDDDWIDGGTKRSVSYSRLPAGDYQFHVTAGNNAGVWNEAGTGFGFRVPPFFWETWSFRVASGLLVAGIGFGASRYIVTRRLNRRLKQLEQENALQKERARIAQDIHDDIGARMTQISYLTDLARQSITTPEKAAEHVTRIAGMSREGIKSLDEIVWAVNPRNDTLADLMDYAGQYAVDFLSTAGIRCRVKFPNPAPDRHLSAETRHGLFMAVKEALHNVAKHSGASEVELCVAVDEHGLKWTVQDNGRGFANAPQDALADGLRNMRKRLSGLGGECAIDGGQGRGTAIQFTLLWSSNGKNGK